MAMKEPIVKEQEFTRTVTVKDNGILGVGASSREVAVPVAKATIIKNYDGMAGQYSVQYTSLEKEGVPFTLSQQKNLGTQVAIAVINSPDFQDKKYLFFKYVNRETGAEVDADYSFNKSDNDPLFKAIETLADNAIKTGKIDEKAVKKLIEGCKKSDSLFRQQEVETPIKKSEFIGHGNVPNAKAGQVTQRGE